MRGIVVLALAVVYFSLIVVLVWTGLNHLFGVAR